MKSCHTLERARALAAVTFPDSNDLTDAFVLLKPLLTMIGELRDGKCLGVIPDTFVACGEGGNWCSELCHRRAVAEWEY